MSENSKLKIIKSLNILYLEDEDNIRKNITETLELFCNKVYESSNAKDALKSFHDNHIDIILSDISMQGMNGIEFVQEIRKFDKKTPIILLTAHTDTKYLLEATKLKLVDYLTKPLNFTQLKKALINASNEILDIRGLVINFEDHIEYHILKKQLLNKGLETNITGKEIALLEFLYENKDRTPSQEEIKDALWEDSYDATDTALKAVLNKLRHKIGKKSIQNISGVGYKLITI